MQLLKYKHLNQCQRYKICALRELGITLDEIAGIIGCHKSTVSRELKRNTGQRGQGAKIYDAEKAQKKADIRKTNKAKHVKLNEKMLRYIRKKLSVEKWSPELISQKGLEKYDEFVSHETIYKYIWKAKFSNHKKLKTDKDLHKNLRHHKRRRKRKNSKGNRGYIPNRVAISKRDKSIESRERTGDLEIDLMMGKNRKPALIVILDRSTLRTELIKIKNKKADYIAAKIIKRLSGNLDLKTITFDNDLAFARHEKIAQALNVKTYFTRPYTSQDKGSVENRIGQLRRFFPKGTSLVDVHCQTIRSIQGKLNNRPVRKFDYRTPNEEKLIKFIGVALTG